jgi:heme exporter protein D
VVTAVAVITSYVIELVRRLSLLEVVVRNTGKEERTRHAKCPCC